VAIKSRRTTGKDIAAKTTNIKWVESSQAGLKFESKKRFRKVTFQ